MADDWARVLAATGEVVHGISDAVVSDWLEKEDGEAYTSIVTQVSTSPTEEVDRLDAALLSFATTNLNPGVRQRLIKFYAIFKITEIRRYQAFRGFPQ
jgi:hypothetical protein